MFKTLPISTIKSLNVQSKHTCHRFTERFIDAYFEDMTALNILAANDYPKVTEHIDHDPTHFIIN